MRVRALSKGFTAGVQRAPGDEFEWAGKELANWMELVGPVPKPTKAAKAKEAKAAKAAEAKAAKDARAAAKVAKVAAKAATKAVRKAAKGPKRAKAGKRPKTGVESFPPFSEPQNPDEFPDKG